MKSSNILLSALAAASLVVAAASCKSKKAATASSTEPTQAQLTAVQAKMPSATMADLKTGHDIFYSQCVECHKAKNVTGYEEDKLHGVVEKMSGKAKLTDAQKDAVWKYALAVNLAAKGQ